MISQLITCNPELKIRSIRDTAFLKYGKVLTQFSFEDCFDIMKNRPIPKEGNCYTACDQEMMQTPVACELSSRFYAGMDIEIGYCNGNSSKLNAFEYHKGSEIDVAVTDFVLLLSHIQNIKKNQLPSSSTEAFYMPAGTACELYGTTLHFAPCKVSADGYKSIIVLPAGTNDPLSVLPSPESEEDQLLWMKNKWLIAHAESIPASKGAFIGITGKNIEVYFN